MSGQWTLTSDEQKEFTTQSQLFEAVNLLDEFLHIEHDELSLRRYWNVVQKFFRANDFDDILIRNLRPDGTSDGQDH
jgi:hypothetical protein